MLVCWCVAVLLCCCVAVLLCCCVAFLLSCCVGVGVFVGVLVFVLTVVTFCFALSGQQTSIIPLFGGKVKGGVPFLARPGAGLTKTSLGSAWALSCFGLASARLSGRPLAEQK